MEEARPELHGALMQQDPQQLATTPSDNHDTTRYKGSKVTHSDDSDKFGGRNSGKMFGRTTEEKARDDKISEDRAWDNTRTLAHQERKKQAEEMATQLAASRDGRGKGGTQPREMSASSNNPQNSVPTPPPPPTKTHNPIADSTGGPRPPQPPRAKAPPPKSHHIEAAKRDEEAKWKDDGKGRGRGHHKKDGKGRGKEQPSWEHPQTWGAAWQTSWASHPWAEEKRWNVLDNRYQTARHTTASTGAADSEGDLEMHWDENEYSGEYNPWTDGGF